MSGYIPLRIRNRIRKQANNRCGYCLSRQRYVFGPLEIEHIIPKSCGGSDEESNLWLACRLCNSYKGSQIDVVDALTEDRIPLFNPRQQEWLAHFKWDETGTSIQGITDCGRATVVALQLNNVLAVTVRRAWVEAGWHPPVDL